LAGTDVIAVGHRALYWPEGGALLIADLHLGKADVFRRAGIAVPSGGTADDLQRLRSLVQTSQCRQLWILGDIVHGPLQTAPWLQQWLNWRRQHAKLEVHLLRGNHDRSVSAATLDIEVHEQDLALGPFRLRHEPGAPPDTGQGHVLCGHLHPQASFSGMPRRWPAFWLRERMTILPAFSRFTAGTRPRLAPGERLLACVDGSVVPLPLAR